jgi:hypothetical protein
VCARVACGAWSSSPSTSPLDRGRVCHRHRKCPVDFCAGCHRSRRLLSNLGCIKWQTASVDTCRCLPNPEHSRVQLPIGLSVAYAFCAGIFLGARIKRLGSFASNTCGSDFGKCVAGARRCVSTVAFRTRCLERRSGVYSCSHTVFHGGSRTPCSIRYRPHGSRCVFPWSGRSVGDFDHIGSTVPICPARRLTICSCVIAPLQRSFVGSVTFGSPAAGAERRKTACAPVPGPQPHRWFWSRPVRLRCVMGERQLCTRVGSTRPYFLLPTIWPGLVVTIKRWHERTRGERFPERHNR